MCREVLEDGSICLAAVSKATPLPCESYEDIEVSIPPEVRGWQREMAALLRRQTLNGGQIDISVKDEVIDETWVGMLLQTVTV